MARFTEQGTARWDVAVDPPVDGDAAWQARLLEEVRPLLERRLLENPGTRELVWRSRLLTVRAWRVGPAGQAGRPGQPLLLQYLGPASTLRISPAASGVWWKIAGGLAVAGSLAAALTVRPQPAPPPRRLGPAVATLSPRKADSRPSGMRSAVTAGSPKQPGAEDRAGRVRHGRPQTAARARKRSVSHHPVRAHAAAKTPLVRRSLRQSARWMAARRARSAPPCAPSNWIARSRGRAEGSSPPRRRAMIIRRWRWWDPEDGCGSGVRPHEWQALTPFAGDDW